jgi:hypothetical protein
MRIFGIDGDTATKLENAIGTKAFMEFAYRLGSATGEHGGAAGLENAATNGSALTPAQALAEIARLKADREWGKAYAKGDAEKSRAWSSSTSGRTPADQQLKSEHPRWCNAIAR